MKLLEHFQYFHSIALSKFKKPYAISVIIFGADFKILILSDDEMVLKISFVYLKQLIF